VDLSYLVKKNPFIQGNPFKMRFDRESFISIMRMGLPSGIQQALIAAGFMTLTGIVNLFGTDPAAAFAAASKLESFAVMPAMNFSLAIASFTGQNLGAGRIDRFAAGFSLES
jgi:Na+-driven multidrug efflux pump